MSVSRSMNLRDFKGYIKQLKKNLAGSNGVDSAISRGIHSGIMRALPIVQAATVNAMPASPNGSIGAVDTGAYRQAWAFELWPTGGRIFNTRPYAGVIEGGRRAGSKRPPTRALKLWAMRKLGLSEEEAESASYAIANAIAKRGLAGRKVLTGPMTSSQITQAVMEEIRNEVQASIKRGGKK